VVKYNTREEMLENLDSWYDNWIKKQEVETIDEEEVKTIVKEEIELLSKMTVEELTLFQKWNSLNALYPLNTNPFLRIPFEEQYPLVHTVQNNIWIPTDSDDYKKLEPIVVAAKTKLEKDIWNILRHFISTMEHKGAFGRSLKFTVKDQITDKYLGVFAVSSDYMDLKARDDYIGWTRKQKTDKMLKYTAVGSTIVPTQPLGYNYLGGKLMALLTLSTPVRKEWKDVYQNTITGITTTSLYGSFSQYNSLKYWKKLGRTSGTRHFSHTDPTWYLMKKYLLYKEPRTYFNFFIARHTSGPYKRDGKQRAIERVYKLLNINPDVFVTKHQRGVYFAPLYTNTLRFLREEDLKLKEELFDSSVESLVNLWKNKYAKKRLTNLKEAGKLNLTETLFYENLIGRSWEQVRSECLTNIGR
jgi:hypothetical protein